ncbi:hypothetical protein CHGG_05336 [Chaetomium globosum CBS 148.51]|uniref:Decapping nuclease n=1 Tax=Chaetomium globosum (strain ATCC 6205 / CBS 148.51 / DSM 1962 / NBRC 6347 / NRRL 1970) TaxID=306901 RepID=Q2H7M9_CHAGB|nr:uncharacterized protein CHGG_05336 [Chaetomium globosum CBS 148.51]EAQ88717.1 hypothetical protein CHGG_05336 [Chaetomium globosum CBS 148.51]
MPSPIVDVPKASSFNLDAALDFIHDETHPFPQEYVPAEAKTVPTHIKCPLFGGGKRPQDRDAKDRAAVHRLRRRRMTEVSSGLVHLESLAILPIGIDAEPSRITDVQELASFNKVADGEIVVPARDAGAPPRFTPLTQPLQMKADSYNKAIPTRYPQYDYIFEPLLRSVEVMQPGLDIFSATDVISNVSNLRKLFDVISNRSWGTERCDIDIRENTLLLSRWNGDPNLSLSLGCGSGFEKETCRYPPEEDPVLQRSLSHHRVLSYRFAGLQLVVQGEVDAYHCACDHTTPSPDLVSTTPRTTKRHSDPAPRSPSWRHRRAFSNPHALGPSPSLAFAALALDDPGDSPGFTPPCPVTHPSPTLRVHHTGRAIPAPCLVEIKTRNARSPALSTNEAQLYFSQRAKLYLARHEQGLFTPGPELSVREVETELREWEAEAQQQVTLGKLAGLLRVVRDRVRVLRGQGVERVSLVCECDGTGSEQGVSVRLCERAGGGGQWAVAAGGIPPDG